jgi:rhodanese-related sulfurtransferase
MQFLTVQEFLKVVDEGAIVVDTRPSLHFSDGYYKGAISVPFNPLFIQSLQNLFEDESLVFISDPADVAAIQKVLVSSAVFSCKGFLEGGFQTATEANLPIDILINIEADEFAIDYSFDEFFLIDLRTAEEFNEEHVEDSENIPLTDLPPLLAEMDETASFYLYANATEDAITGGSIFKQNEFHRLRVVSTPFAEIVKEKIPVFRKNKKQRSHEN